jgi:hypothetical protein
VIRDAVENLWSELKLTFTFSDNDKKVLSIILVVLLVLYMIGVFL